MYVILSVSVRVPMSLRTSFIELQAEPNHHYSPCRGRRGVFCGGGLNYEYIMMGGVLLARGPRKKFAPGPGWLLAALMPRYRAWTDSAPFGVIIFEKCFFFFLPDK